MGLGFTGPLERRGSVETSVWSVCSELGALVVFGECQTRGVDVQSAQNVVD